MYALYDANGKIIHFLDVIKSDDVPSNAIEVSLEDHYAAANDLSNWSVDITTKKLVNKTVLSNAERWVDLRITRDILLFRSDWTQLPDAPLASQKKIEWATYRQQLRDLPKTYPNPSGVIWPVVPKK